MEIKSPKNKSTDACNDIYVFQNNNLNIITHNDLEEQDKQIYNKYYDIASRIYSQLSLGHTEAVYHKAFEYELQNLNILFEREKNVPILYKLSDDKFVNVGNERIDLYIENDKLIIELKAITQTLKDQEKYQLLKYYKQLLLYNCKPKYGFLINFHQCGTKNISKNIDVIFVIFK